MFEILCRRIMLEIFCIDLGEVKSNISSQVGEEYPIYN